MLTREQQAIKRDIEAHIEQCWAILTDVMRSRNQEPQPAVTPGHIHQQSTQQRRKS